MVLIIGGVGQGKLDYTLQKTGLTEQDVARTPEEACHKPVFAGLETWVRNTGAPEGAIDSLLAANPSVIILCDEVGCGVVPLLPEERVWRERVGRLCCHLAERAGRVERVFCGLGMTLKGEEPWS